MMMKRALRIVLASVSFASAIVVGGAPLGGCLEGSTTGRRIALDVRIAASPESRRFTNAAGWEITVTKARLSTGALYYFDGTTIFASRARGSARFGVREAHAHPGHYAAGEAKGELLAHSSADLLAGAVLGSGAGVSGSVRSATFSFASPAAGPFASELGANVAIVEATATRGAETRVLRAELGPDDVRSASGGLEVEGCPFVEADMQGDGAVAIMVKLDRWFDQVELEDVPPSPDGSPVVLPQGLARNQLTRGARAGLAYAFSYAPR